MSKLDFDYRLTTGRLWGNQQIDDFELQIEMDGISYFSVPFSFGKNQLAHWKIEGEGKVDDRKVHAFPGAAATRMVLLKNGRLILKQKNFQPDSDLSISAPIQFPYGYFLDNSEDELIPFYYDLYCPENETLNHLSKEKLALLRNYLFAKYGYSFKSEKWKGYFEKFHWYLPTDQEVTPKMFSKADLAFYRKIREAEARK